MTLLILGVLLWAFAHLFKRIAPAARARLGDPGKGLVAALLVLSLVLMVLGYRAAPIGDVFWGRSPALTGINNLLMLLAVYLFAVSGMKTRLARVIRHPMLTGVKTWAVAHLLVNGDVPSFILFGGLLIWAVVEVIVINRQTEWVKPAPAPMGKEIRAAIGALIVFAVIAFIHTWLGYPPFG
ncbi:NnrU family protein [Aquicoccus sp. G2-2]|uniref:NnrU family protein n=1 Tax=Aquicoccus sp. G2-2 TaxID=3092120 RepID=UPI002ADFD74F|nr:NnrU family protein [Aquicoccus sp. G2-2]MEA1112384.1 NnrU family protein [Aquicoccus sp. G2-2]